jgi:hypothetical protein
MRFRTPLDLLCNRRRRRPSYPWDAIPTEELMRQQGITGPQGLEIWKQCPWGGDDEEAIRFRRIIEEEFG